MGHVTCPGGNFPVGNIKTGLGTFWRVSHHRVSLGGFYLYFWSEVLSDFRQFQSPASGRHPQSSSCSSSSVLSAGNGACAEADGEIPRHPAGRFPAKCTRSPPSLTLLFTHPPLASLPWVMVSVKCWAWGWWCFFGGGRNNRPCAICSQRMENSCLLPLGWWGRSHL